MKSVYQQYKELVEAEQDLDQLIVERIISIYETAPCPDDTLATLLQARRQVRAKRIAFLQIP